MFPIGQQQFKKKKANLTGQPLPFIPVVVQTVIGLQVRRIFNEEPSNLYLQGF
jgi:hypothetical protein